MIKRRTFLKLGGAAATLLIIPLNQLNRLVQAPLEVLINNILYRGTLDGKLFTSKDQGKTWNIHTNFGSDFAILDIFAGKPGQININIGYQHYSFYLMAAEQEKIWRTVSSI